MQEEDLREVLFWSTESKHLKGQLAPRVSHVTFLDPGFLAAPAQKLLRIVFQTYMSFFRVSNPKKKVFPTARPKIRSYGDTKFRTS